jgi:catechol 2,3-dioxygenase-like lactoylglutathione lyase family enzyme
MSNSDVSKTPIGRLHDIAIDVEDLDRSARFWSALLGLTGGQRRGNYHDLGLLDGGLRVYLQKVPEKKTAKNRMHLDFAAEDIDAACAQVEALGGQKLQAFDKYGQQWIVMADPDGNEFCLAQSQ